MLSTLSDKIQYINSIWQQFIEHLFVVEHRIKNNETKREELNKSSALKELVVWRGKATYKPLTIIQTEQVL